MSGSSEWPMGILGYNSDLFIVTTLAGLCYTCTLFKLEDSSKNQANGIS